MPRDAHEARRGAARRRLTHLAGLQLATDQTERAILEKAETRLEAVEGDLEKLRPRVHAEPALADRYLALTAERGQLQLVAARSRAILTGETPEAA